MAGGKETPRQKMINLMYLVLLALLALQVGAEIMNKFFELNESMVVLVEEADEKAAATFAAIEKKVADDGRDEAKEALKQARILDQATNKVHVLIDELKAEMVEKTGGYDPETNLPLGMKNTDISGQIMLGNSGQGSDKGKKLEQYMTDFEKTLNNVQSSVAKLLPEEKANLYADMNLTPSGKEHPLFKNSDDHKTANWLQISFDHTPMIAALAFLTEKEARVANLRAEVLEKIKISMNAKDIKFDDIFPMASAESKVVAAGTDYEAKLFITARSSAKSFDPKMYRDGKEIPVTNAEGKVKFRASWGGGKIDPKNKNLMTKKWKGKILLKDGTGKETPYEETFEYVVAKPVLQVQSASVAALYRQCGNELIINCPALGVNYNPSFSASGASVRKGKKKGEVVIIPGAGSNAVSLNVSSGGTKLGTEKFKVRDVPRPNVAVYAKGKEIDQKRGMTAPGPRRLIVKAEISDDYFKNNLPRDSKYGVSDWTAMLVRGRRPIGSPKKFSGADGNISSISGSAQPGDRILIEIKEVRRRKYLGGSEVVKISGSPIVNIPLN